MEICLISKYPPIEGFVSSYTYWLARGLGKRGTKVHVVTNAAEVEKRYRERLDKDDPQYTPQNVMVHNTWFTRKQAYIPLSNPYTEKLASIGIDIIRNYGVKIVDCRYLIPYGISGFICKTITGRSLILRHAGSDVGRILSSPFLNTLFIEVLNKADIVVSSSLLFASYLKNLGISNQRIVIINEAVDTSAFSPSAEPLDLSKYLHKEIRDEPVITYVGKALEKKGLFELIKALSKIRELDFVLLLVTQGGLTKFAKRMVETGKLLEKTIFLGYVPPWRMPSVYQVSTCIVTMEYGFSIQHVPIIPREAIALSKCVFLSKDVHRVGFYPLLKDEYSMMEVRPPNIEQIAKKLEIVIKNPDRAITLGKRAKETFQKIENFKDYIEKNIRLYKSLIE